MTTPAAADLVRVLGSWRAPDDRLEQLRLEYLDLVDARGAAALRRDGGPEHVTASCFLFSADLRRTLLCFHRKGQFWVQTGGHLEPQDPTVEAAGLREASEEAGLGGLVAAPGVLDLDRHDLGAGFGLCRTHWDVGFAAVVDVDEPVLVSEESEAVAWFAVDDLPVPLAGRVETRVVQLRDALRPV